MGVAPALEALVSGHPDTCARDIYLDLLAQRSSQEGPWLEDLFVVWSPDGINIDLSQATPIKTSAAVPDVIRGDDGRYYLFYGTGDIDLGVEHAIGRSDWFSTHGLIGYGAFDLMVSDDGIHFSPVEEFEINGLVRGMVVDPDVVAGQDGWFHMYYVGLPVPEMVAPDAWAEEKEHKVYHAISDDLITWQQIGEVVSGPNADPSVLCLDDRRCVMSSTGLDWSWSFDGGRSFRFQKYGEPWGFAPELTRFEGGAIRLYYNSKVSGGALMSRRSDDGGLTWVDEGTIVGPRKVEAVSVVPAPTDGWLIYYHYWQEGYSGDSWGQ